MDVVDPGVPALAGPDAPAHLAALRRSGEVVPVGSLDAWLVLGHAAAVEVMRDPATFTVQDPRFSTARVVGPSMLSLDGGEHRRHRAPFVPPYRPAKVEERYAEDTRRLVADLLGPVRGLGSAELRTTLAGPLSAAVMGLVLGLGDVDARTVLRWYAAIVDAVSRLSAGDAVGPDAAPAVAELGDRLATTTPDSVLTGARGTLSRDEVVANAAVMMFGGIETTEGMVLNAVAHVLGDAAALAAVRADPSLVGAAVEESLRLEPAAAAVDRYATRDVDLRGARLRRGDLVRVSLTAANRDPEVFERPDVFDPARFAAGRPRAREQLAFARGPHACLAAELARLETRTALAAVLELPGVRLEEAEPATGLVFRKPDRLRIAWEV